MLTFKYEAISKDGLTVSGVVEAYNEYEAIAQIKENCSVLLKIQQVQGEQIGDKAAGGKIKLKSLALLCSEFSIITKAGLPIVRAVELIAAQTSDRNLKYILEQVGLDVSAGFGLAQSFENNGPNLPSTFIETIRSGEDSGSLDVAFERLYRYYDKSAKLRGKVVSALAYPAFVCVVAVISIFVIMTYAVPAFVGNFIEMGSELPLATKALIATSDFFGSYSLHMLGTIAILALCFVFYNKSEQGHIKLSEMKLKLPLLGKINIMKSASEYANTMSTMLASGLPIIRSVSVTSRAMTNDYIGGLMEAVAIDLEEGRALAPSLRKIAYLPDLLVEMTNVGEETGTLETTLDVIAVFYDNETELQTGRLVSLMEPMIICVLAIVVAWILLAVYVPMFSMYGSM